MQKQDIISWLDENTPRFTPIADEIWTNPEIAFQEFKASKLQADFLEGEGFKITWDVAEMNTAFIAEWGEGKPIIGFAGEYDALPGLSQKRQSSQEAIVEGAPGHGCGHNLLGTGCMASAAAVKTWLESTGTPGTVRYYGCPAEERGSGKGFMARAGVFDDLDAAFNFHPMYANMAAKGSMVAVNELKFRFHGKSAHAGASPHLGRSALDAVELMNVGVNYLREHVTEKVRMHYVITNGGEAPNIVPPNAEVWYYIRAPLLAELEEVTNRVRKVAEGAAMMTETKMEEIFIAGISNVLNNHALADLQYEAMQAVGPLEFTEEEIAYAQEINDNYEGNVLGGLASAFGLSPEVLNLPLISGNLPSMDEGLVITGSTDVGDLSWSAPVSMLTTACWPTGAPAHSWGVVATVGSSIGHKGMMHAAKIMALAAMDIYTDPKHLEAIRKEFDAALEANPYTNPIPEEIKPPRYERVGD